MNAALLQSEVEELKAENQRLLLRVKSLEKDLYGSRADRRKPENPDQTTFASIEEAVAEEQQEEPAATPVRKRAERKGKKKGPKPLNPDLRREQVEVPDPDLKELICPITGKLMSKAFPQTVEVLSRKPAEYFVRVFTRWVHASPEGDAVAYSPWPSDVMPRSRIDASVVASVLCSRFADHQPYNRQSQQLARHGVELAPGTIGSMARIASEMLEPVYNAVIQQTLGHKYLMMDPTPVRMKSKHKKGTTTEACLWTYRALDGPVFFEFAQSKRGITPANTLRTYQGILQTDGASNFGGVPERADITHLNCWAHARRYFLKAEDSGDTRASEYLDMIDRLFRRERIMKRYDLTPDQVLELRRRYSLPEVDDLFRKLQEYLETERMKKTDLPKAASYTLARTGPLRECFLHARSRIDNNLAEGALRPIKLGAKNWLFIGHENAGPRTAMMYTLVSNCNMLGINPEEYLIDVLTRVNKASTSEIEELTPHRWFKSKNN